MPPGPYFQGEHQIGTTVPITSFFIATDGPKILGMMGAIPLDERYWYGSHLYVAPEARGRGVGRSIMEAAAAFHEQNGRDRALATPILSAVETFESLGFKTVGQMMEWEHA